MKFSYIASKPDGKTVRGTVEAPSQAAVLSFLGQRELRPVSVLPATAGGGLFRRSINATDIIFLTKYLALMLRAGTDLFRALDILIADFEKPAMKALLMEIRESLERGQPFYTTFARYPKQFELVFVNLVKAGELSGNLESVFENLSVMLVKKEDLRRRIVSALTYPAILFVASMGIVTFLVTFALPRIADVFKSGGFTPPGFVAWVFIFAEFVSNNILPLGIMGLLSAVFLWVFFFRTVLGRAYLFALLRHVPVVRGVLQRIAIQRFASTLSSLLRAGLPIIDSLELTATAVGDYAFETALQHIAREGIARGLTLGDAFRREAAFPLVITTLIGVSEKAGHLDEVLATLGSFYDSEIDASIKNMVTLIEPLMLIILGGIVGLIALSVIIPIYQLIGQF